jgi:hypothetical protein
MVQLAQAAMANVLHVQDHHQAASLVTQIDPERLPVDVMLLFMKIVVVVLLAVHPV